MNAPLLELRNVHKRFPVRGGLPFSRPATLRAVDDVSLTIARGEAFGLVGESGSGKSTVGRLLLGLVKPTSGSVLIDDVEVLSARPSSLARRGLARTFQVSALAPERRVWLCTAISSPSHIPPSRACTRPEAMGQIGPSSVSK